MVGRLLSFWEGLFSGDMLVSGRVPSKIKNTEDTTANCGYQVSGGWSEVTLHRTSFWYHGCKFINFGWMPFGLQQLGPTCRWTQDWMVLTQQRMYTAIMASVASLSSTQPFWCMLSLLAVRWSSTNLIWCHDKSLLQMKHQNFSRH